MDIFEELREKVGCMYISDLKCNPEANEMAKSIVKTLDLSKCEDKVLDDLAEYLYGDKSQREKLFSKKENAVCN